jgi:CBS domain-containing protein
MAQSIREVMTSNPVALPADTPVAEAAKRMQSEDIGDVILLRDGEIAGVVTDRDIVVRVVAEDRSPTDTPLADIASKELVTLGPDDTVEDAVRIMRDRAIRRIPVVEEGKPVGIVSIGDLAIERDPRSALADISSTEPNE